MGPNKAIETVVGFFVLTGLALVGWMILVFGGLAEKWDESYELTVEFPNASGLLKGSKIYFAGAHVGRVASAPKLIQEGRAVEVVLRVRADVKIRRDAEFVISSSGLLGDRFVDIQPRGTSEPFWENGDRVPGKRNPEITDLANDAQQIAAKVQEFMRRVDREFLTPEVAADLKETIKKARSIAERTDDLLAQAQRGQGPLAKILNDPKLADDLSSLISNLRRNGVLFYKDDASKVEATHTERKGRK